MGEVTRLLTIKLQSERELLLPISEFAPHPRMTHFRLDFSIICSLAEERDSPEAPGETILFSPPSSAIELRRQTAAAKNPPRELIENIQFGPQREGGEKKAKSA